jgi:hypothetical protein
MTYGTIKLYIMIDQTTSMPNTTLLTGIPRSGTTLICKLLSECPNVIALNEPLPGHLFSSRGASLEMLSEQIYMIRQSLLQHKKAPARTKYGTITDNAFGENEGQRKKEITRTEVYFDKPLHLDFTLILNHNAEFTLLLPELADFYRVVAIVRNPLDLLSSWNSVDLPVSRGKVSKADRLLPTLCDRYLSKSDLLAKQLEILDWYFGQYENPAIKDVIRYEDVIASHGKVLDVIAGAEISGWELVSKNKNELYEKGSRAHFKQAILEYGGNWLSFYEGKEIEKDVF